MPANNEHTFKISVSEQNFDSKPEKGDGKMASLIFKPQEITIPELLTLALNGKVFCSVFNSSEPDGSFNIKNKTRDNYLSTSAFFFDFDKMDMSLNDFVDKKVKYKPSIAYTTFSNGTDGYRYRLVYVFYNPITGVSKFNALYNDIVNANNFPIETSEQGGLDTHTKNRCEQCYFGTNSFAEFYYNPYGTLYYTSYDFEKYIDTSSTEPEITINYNTYKASNTPDSISIDERFLNDFYHNDDFIQKYFHQYYPNYKTSLETPLILDESQMFYTFPEFYVAVTHIWNGKETLKWQIGSNRRKKMYATAYIMLYNNPSLTIENLLFNLRLEREWYYINTDNKVDNGYLVYVAKRAMTIPYQLNQTKHGKFKVNKEFWFEQGITANQAKNIISRLINVQKVKSYYNPYLTYKQNLDILKSNEIEVSERTLKRMVSRGDIEKNNKNEGYTYLSECRSNVTNPITNAIIALLREDGTRTQSTIADMLDVDIRTIKRYFKDMNGKFIVREGNNRTGKWIVIDNPENGDRGDIENVSKLPILSEQTILS